MDNEPRQTGITLFLYSRINAAKLEERLKNHHDIDVNIRPVRPPPGGLQIPGKRDIVVVDLDYCDTEARTALFCVAPIRGAGFTGPIIVNENGNENSSLLHVAGATHSVPLLPEEKNNAGTRLAATVFDAIRDLEQLEELQRERAAQGQGMLKLEKI